MKLKWFAVQGRVPRDDDDSVLVFRAKNVDGAKRQFRNAMCGGRSREDIKKCDEQFDSNGGVYIVSVLESDTEIREAA
jgi:hypothetical protein